MKKKKFDPARITQGLMGKAKKYMGDSDRMKDLLSSASVKVKDNNQLAGMIDDIGLALNLARDYTKKNYKDVSKASIAAIVAGIIYLVNPMDIIPDFFVAGFLDDAAVFGYILTRVKDELDKYRTWKNSNR